MHAFFAAQKRGIPAWMAGLQPWTPTREVPLALAPTGVPLTGLGNYLSYILFENLVWLPFRAQANAWSQKYMGATLPAQPFAALRRAKVPVLYGFSEVLMPRPRDWAEHVHMTGYWFLDQPDSFTPPPALAEFLAAGPKPIYLGFGSMVDRTPEATSHLVLDALERTGQRCVLSQGWSGLANARDSKNVITVGSIPHDWLFPRMSAIVHHGGAGTTAAAMRAGVPALVVPFFADQYFWADRVRRAGLGPTPVPKARLTANKLAEGLTSIATSHKMHVSAEAAGRIIRGERGLERALQIMGLDRGGALGQPLPTKPKRVRRMAQPQV